MANMAGWPVCKIFDTRLWKNRYRGYVHLSIVEMAKIWDKLPKLWKMAINGKMTINGKVAINGQYDRVLLASYDTNNTSYVEICPKIEPPWGTSLRSVFAVMLVSPWKIFLKKWPRVFKSG